MSCICFYTDPGSVYPVIDPNNIEVELPHNYGYGFFQDLVDVRVEDDITLTRCQLRVVLKTASKIWRRKELLAWNYCQGSFSQLVTTAGADHGPQEMLLRKASCHSGHDTILFKKADWFGVTHGMYTFNSIDLWKFWGGKKVTFVWFEDDYGSGVWGENSLIQDGKIPDGTVMTANGRPEFVFQGLARFRIPSPAVRTSLGLDQAPTITVDPSVLDNPRLRTKPVDFTLLRELSWAQVYVFFGGAAFPLPDPLTAGRIGVDLTLTRLVPDGALKENEIGNVPRDGTVLRELSTAPVFVMKRGTKFGFPSAARFEELCFSWDNVRVVPDGALASIPYGGTV